MMLGCPTSGGPLYHRLSGHTGPDWKQHICTFLHFLHTWLKMNSTKTILLYFSVVLIREEKNYLQFFAVFI